MKRRRIVPLVLGLALLAVFLLMTFFPSIFTPHGAKDMFPAWLGASGTHILGTNALGYDIFAELVHGAKDTLLIGVSSSVIALFLGALIGILSTVRGIAGGFFNSLINIFVLLPKLITLIVLASFVGSSSINLIILISAFGWVGVARNVRAKVMHLNAQPFVENCLIYGYSRAHIMLRHIVPNLQDVLLPRFLLGVNSCIMMESTLSFLGFGDLYHPTWGTMINFAYKRGAFIRQAYNYLLAPGLCIMLLSLSFYFLSLYFEGQKEIIQEG